MDDLQHSQSLYPRGLLAHFRICRARALEIRDEEGVQAGLDLRGCGLGEDGAGFEEGDEGEEV